jgi:D-3-phosphoglycerate dehydrogenase
VPKVLVTDSLAPQGLEILERARGIAVEYEPGMPPGELLQAIADAEGLVIRSGTKVTADVIAAAHKLQVIGRAGIGVDKVDVPAATERGIVVMNTPGGNNVTTAEHALALVISLARHIPQASASMKQGEWEKRRFVGTELFSRTLGVVGLGNIGRIVADRARGLGMKVIGHDPFLSEAVAAMLDVELVSFEDLLRRSDIITVHVPRTKDTTALLGAEAFAKVKPGALIVNAARGGIVDEAALLQAIEAGVVAGAALDVFETEPPPPDHPLLARDEVIATPHLGAATEQAQVNVAIAVAEQVRDYLLDGVVRNAVNLPPVSADELEQLRPYLVLGEKLGLFQGQICTGIEEIDVECAGEITDLNVTPITLAVVKGLLEPWVGERVNFVNAPHVAQERGIRVVESKSASHEDYRAVVTVRVKTDLGEHLVAGAIFGKVQPRIVRVDGFRLEAVPEGASLLIRNNDRPGVVGQVGTLLGEAGVNISRMQLGLQLDGKMALQLLNVDPRPEPPVLDALRANPAIEDVRVLDLGPKVT